MKNLLWSALSIYIFASPAFADHATLENLAAQVTQQSHQLEAGAQRVIGTHPTHSQKYAFEHIQFFHRAAHSFKVVLQGRNGDWDHVHTQKIRQAYRKLSHDLYYARQTFNNLFQGWDHADYLTLNNLLTQIERSVREMHHHLP